MARFELEAHERAERGQALTAEDLNELMADLFSEGYGTEMHVDRERVGSTWAQFPHLYSNFYVFQYATGISAAHALARRLLEGEAGAAATTLGFLQAGAAQYAVPALAAAGRGHAGPGGGGDDLRDTGGLCGAAGGADGVREAAGWRDRLAREWRACFDSGGVRYRVSLICAIILLRLSA